MNYGYDKMKKGMHQREAKVVHFLLENPLSTAEEVFNATGAGVISNCRFLTWTKYGGKTVWRVNRRKWNEYWNNR